ncbi:hypothetical protein A5635_02400 [Mycobacterium asiaticum]|uniref:Uncharacterized protein n=1 Tax=Mycobacterium asiaticum TaxID=1790 RepID=A0A1A3NDC6_MYCAS|nr:hypothetical protein A5635_02400 [Mycobacterium asiaticum]
MVPKLTERAPCPAGATGAALTAAIADRGASGSAADTVTAWHGNPSVYTGSAVSAFATVAAARGRRLKGARATIAPRATLAAIATGGTEAVAPIASVASVASPDTGLACARATAAATTSAASTTTGGAISAATAIAAATRVTELGKNCSAAAAVAAGSSGAANSLCSACPDGGSGTTGATHSGLAPNSALASVTTATTIAEDGLERRRYRWHRRAGRHR